VDRTPHVRVRRALGATLVLHGGEGPAFYFLLRLRAELIGFSLTHQGEINVDQAHRGYDVVVDDAGKMYYNPF
jgi:hypothetical protein